MPIMIREHQKMQYNYLTKVTFNLISDIVTFRLDVTNGCNFIQKKEGP